MEENTKIKDKTLHVNYQNLLQKNFNCDKYLNLDFNNVIIDFITEELNHTMLINAGKFALKYQNQLMNEEQKNIFINNIQKLKVLLDNKNKDNNNLNNIRFEDGYTINEAIKASDKLNEWVKEIENAKIDGQSLSPLEKYVYAYNIATNFYYKEDENAPTSLSRLLIPILSKENENQYIVCSGVANLLAELCNRLNLSCSPFALYGHMINSVYIKDDKYQMDEVFFCDPTLDMYNTNDKLDKLVDKFLDTCQIKRNLISSFNNNTKEDLSWINNNYGSTIYIKFNKLEYVYDNLQDKKEDAIKFHNLNSNYFFKTGGINLKTFEKIDEKIQKIPNTSFSHGPFNDINTNDIYEQALLEVGLDNVEKVFKNIPKEKLNNKICKTALNVFLNNTNKDNYPKTKSILELIPEKIKNENFYQNLINNNFYIESTKYIINNILPENLKTEKFFLDVLLKQNSPSYIKYIFEIIPDNFKTQEFCENLFLKLDNFNLESLFVSAKLYQMIPKNFVNKSFFQNIFKKLYNELNNDDKINSQNIEKIIEKLATIILVIPRQIKTSEFFIEFIKSLPPELIYNLSDFIPEKTIKKEHFLLILEKCPKAIEKYFQNNNGKFANMAKELFLENISIFDKLPPCLQETISTDLEQKDISKILSNHKNELLNENDDIENNI